MDKIIQESLKMSRFKHIHVMRLIGVCTDRGSAPYIIMPYMANGSLLSYLKREKRSILPPDQSNKDEVIIILTTLSAFSLHMKCR